LLRMLFHYLIDWHLNQLNGESQVI